MTTVNRRAAATGAWIFGVVAFCCLAFGVLGPQSADADQLNFGLVAGAILGAISLRYALIAANPDRQDLERSSPIGIFVDILQGAGILIAIVLASIWLTRYIRH